MDMAFIKVLNMSISASWLVLAVLVLRCLLKKSPRWISVTLWALVAVRLICPVSLESVLSLIPEKTTEQMVQSISGGYYGDAMIYSEGSSQYEAAVSAGVKPTVGDNGYHYVITRMDDATKPVQTVAVLYGRIWIGGMVLMALYAWVSWFRLKKKVAPSIDVGNSVFICDYIDTPFILGITKPGIYLPSSLEPDLISYVLAHERAHISRKDHWWKPFGYLLLTVHWFNPVLWLAYILLCRDIELACDEKVIRDMGVNQKKAYSEALLNCSMNRRVIAACPLAFGEVGVKERVKTVVNYKKPAFWLILVAVVALIMTAVCFLTDPVKRDDPDSGTYQVEEIVYRNPAISYHLTEEDVPLFQITKENVLRTKEQDKDWVELGAFDEIVLSDLDFEELFFGMYMGQPREDGLKAWILALPPEESANSTKFYLLFQQENGVMYLGEGMAFKNVYPIHENILDAACNVTWLYRLTDADSNELVSPYTWTSMDRNDQPHSQPPMYSADAFTDPDDAYHICSNLKLTDVIYAWASDVEKVDDSHERRIIRDLTGEQTVQLLDLLHGLPENTFEKADYPTEGSRCLNLFTEEPLTAPCLELKLYENAVYFRFYSDLQTSHQDWKIHSEELKTFLESFYDRDTSEWDRFAPYPIAEGEITFYTNGMEMSIPNYLCFQYEQTDDGIRFKPEDQVGWVLLKAVPGPLEIDSDNLKSQTGIQYGHEAQWVYMDEAEIWSYMNLTMPCENGEYYVRLENEEDAAWVGDFDYHIDIQWVLDNLVIQDKG